MSAPIIPGEVVATPEETDWITSALAGAFRTVHPGAVLVGGRWYSEDDPRLPVRGGRAVSVSVTEVSSWRLDDEEAT